MSTLYFRNDQHTVNTVTGYKVLDENTAVAQIDTGPNGAHAGDPPVWAQYTWYINVYILHSDGSTDQIDSEKAVTSHYCIGQYGYFYHPHNGSATISCPLTSVVATDAINFRVKMDSYNGGAVYVDHVTEQLNVGSLPASTWTVWLFGYHEGEGGPTGWNGPASYGHGDTTFPSRVEDFPDFYDTAPLPILLFT